MIICLQETFLKDKKEINFQEYQQYNYIENTKCKACGGVSILIKNDIPPSKIELKTELQAVAIKVTLHRPINLCSIYHPPHQQIDEDKVENLIQKMPKPFILLGDFNNHNLMGM